MEGELPVGMRALIDRMIQKASMKLKTLGELETVKEKETVMGPGIDYPGPGS